jgi:hypothetical protein
MARVKIDPGPPPYPGPISRHMLPSQAHFPSEGESSKLQENISQEYNVIVKYVKEIKKKYALAELKKLICL